LNQFDSHKVVREMHDRIIVGLAKQLDAPLLTPLLTIDTQLKAANLTTVVW
jgi:hypothetical protein